VSVKIYLGCFRVRTVQDCCLILVVSNYNFNLNNGRILYWSLRKHWVHVWKIQAPNYFRAADLSFQGSVSSIMNEFYKTVFHTDFHAEKLRITNLIFRN
jgi:hypothetical protein